MNLVFREVVGYLNTATRRPAAFPLRVLYDCALPDHSRKLQAQKKPQAFGYGQSASRGVFSTWR